MGRTILSNSISKIVQPISEENNKSRNKAIKEVALFLERCYREFSKYDDMKNSKSRIHIKEATQMEEKIVDLINGVKEEINLKLLDIACFENADGREGLKEVLKNEIDKIIVEYTGENTKYPFEDFAKASVVKDFEEMNKTLTTRKLDHIRNHPLTENKVIPIIQKPSKKIQKHNNLAPWQIDVMNGENTELFKSTRIQGDYGIEKNSDNITDLNAFRDRRKYRRDDEGR